MAWLDTVFKFIGLARFNVVTPALTNGQTSEFQCDSSGRLLVNAQASNTYWSDGGVATSERVVKNTAGRVHQIFGRNTGVTDRYVFVFNHNASGAGARPANGSTAHLFVPVKVKAGEAFSIDLDRSRAFATGLYWGASSTDATFTYDGTATFEIAAEYE